MIQKIENELIHIYRELHIKGSPEWSYMPDYVVPTIPFIGKDYFDSNPRIIIYASAEYLLSHVPGEDEAWDDLLKSFNRHRESFENWNNTLAENRSFFPDINMQPMTDGGLLCSISYIQLKKLNVEMKGKPENLIESISAANVCKFTAADSYDYCPNNVTKRNCSLPYFEADLQLLQPEMIVIPKTILNHDSVAMIIEKICPKVSLIPIYQFSTKAIRSSLGHLDGKAIQLESEIQNRFPSLHKWIKKVDSRYTGKDVYRYLAHLDKVLM